MILGVYDGLAGRTVGATEPARIEDARRYAIAPDGAMPVLQAAPVARPVATPSAGGAGITVNAPKLPETASGRPVAPSAPARLALAPQLEPGPFVDGRSVALYLGALLLFVLLIVYEGDE